MRPRPTLRALHPRPASTLDWPLLVVLLALCFAGLVNLHSAVLDTPHADKLEQQIAWMTAGWVALIAASRTDHRTILRFAWPLLGITLVFLLLVDLSPLGESAKGARRWLRVGSLRGQPSEAAKLVVILCMTRFLSDPPGRRISLRLAQLGALAACVALIAAQPDLGTSLIVAGIALSMTFLGARKLTVPTLIVAAAILSAPFAWEHMAPYQKERLLAFADTEHDPKQGNWQTRQSVMAVGSGQMWGKGWTAGTQHRLEFLPEPETDFPYAVWAEEWGFAGSLTLLFALLFVVGRLLAHASRTRDGPARLVICGVAVLFFWHTVINIAMALGVAPVVGITLPLLSYGGSSLVVVLASLGVALSASAPSPTSARSA